MGTDGHGHGPDGRDPHHGRGHEHDRHGDGHDGHPHRPGREDDHGAGLLARLRELLAPHAHDAASALDSALEGSREGIRAVQTSLAALAVTAGIQAAVVLATGSVALLGDTLHNLADAGTALPLWLAFTLGRRRPDRCYTYGYGRAEDLAGVAVVLMIAVSVVFAATEAVARLRDPHEVRYLGAVAAAGVVGCLGNELVARHRIRVGRRIGSAALVADGRHARTDALTSLAVVAGAAGVALGHPLADPIAGLLVAVAILAVLRDTARDVYRRLMDAVDPALVDAVEESLRRVPGIEALGEVRLRWVGHRLRAEASVVVDAGITVAAGHEIAEAAHHALLHDVPRLADALIHADPSPAGGVDHHAATAHHRPRP